MDAFHWIVVPISTILGLTIARVLSAYVAVFKGRDRIRFDWLPLLLAAAVLGEGLQLWWAMLELAKIASWSLADFTLLVAMAMLLFTAGALVAPSETDTDMQSAFHRDGRWALLALACFHVLAIAANWLLWSTPPWTPLQALLAVLAILSVYGAFTRSRFAQACVVVTYIAISAADTLVASVSAY